MIEPETKFLNARIEALTAELENKNNTLSSIKFHLSNLKLSGSNKKTVEEVVKWCS